MSERVSGGHADALWRWFWGIVLAVGVGAYLWLRVATPLASAPFSGILHGNDFKHIYLGAWMLNNGMNPYDAAALQRMAALRFGAGNPVAVNPYVYLPFTGIVMSPLTWLGPPEAMRIWFVLNHFLLLGGLALAFRSLGLRPTVRDVAVWACVAAGYFPLARTLTAGQLNCALFFLFALVYALDRRGWPVAAGVVAAFAFLYKLAPGILLAWFLWRAVGEVLAQRRTGVSPVSPDAAPDSERDRRGACPTLLRSPALRAALAMVVATGLFLGLSVARVGVQTHLAFRPLLEQMGYGKSTWAEFGQHFYRDPANQSFNSLFHHLVAVPGDEGNGTNGTDGTDGTNGRDGKIAREEGGTTPWVNLGPGWANGLTSVAFLACFGLVLWRTRPRFGSGIAELHSAPWGNSAECNSAIPGRLPPPSSRESLDTDLARSFGLFVLLGLLAPSIYWDHYGVIALWPLLAVYARLPERVRGGAFVVAVGAWLALSAFREMGAAGTSVPLAVALGSAAWLVAMGRKDGLVATAWGLAAALLGARYWFDAPGLRHGVGLLGMSIGLWGTLIVFGLCLAEGRREAADRR